MVFLFKLKLTYLKSEISSFESESKLKQNEILVKHTGVAGNWLFYLLVVCKQLTHFDLPEEKKKKVDSKDITQSRTSLPPGNGTELAQSH